MSYKLDDVVRIARAHNTYLSDLRTHAATFPENEWSEKGRHEYLGSRGYLEAKSKYESEVPTDVRERLSPDVSNLLKRLLDPAIKGDTALTQSPNFEEHDGDEGND